MKQKKPKFSPEEARARRDQIHDRLLGSVTALSDTEGFQRFLKIRTSATMRRYSLNNQLLIAFQDPDATMVMGFRQWLALGRCVRKGEHGLKILGPRLKKYEDEETGEEHRALIGFLSLTMFDVAQTDGDPIETPDIAVHGDDAASDGIEWWTRLVGFANDMDVTVCTQELNGPLGYYKPHEKQIVIETSLDRNGKIHTMVHELVHAMGVGYAEHGRETAELITETAAAIVCIDLGLDTIEASAAYLASWANGKTETVRDQLAAADAIARKLEEALCLDRELVKV